MSQSWADGRGATAADQAGVDDVAFVRHLLDHLESTYRVDPRRVFVTGISNGAFMAHRLAATAGRTRRLDLPDGRRRN